MELNENALKVLERRYLAKDENGNIVETPEDMMRRVARTIALADLNYGENYDAKKTEEEFFDLMSNLKFIPNSPTLMNAGRPLGQLSACFVLPIEDSMEGIFDSVKNAALIHKSGGGTGFSFSRLRAKGSAVATTGGVASGPISFMKVFNSATEAVKQGGCVARDTLVATSNGITRIDEIGPCDAQPKSWHKHDLKVVTDEGIKDSDEFYNNGYSKTITLKTKCGYTVTATEEHRFRVINEAGEYVWKHLKDIKAGDYIVLQKDFYFDNENYKFPEYNVEPHFNATKINIPEFPTEELGEFIGYFMGDGAISINEHGTGRLILTIADKEEEVKNRMIHIAEKIFGLTPCIQKKPDDNSTNYFFNSTVLTNWLRFIGVDKKSSIDANVPEVIFKGSKSFAKGFIRGLFSADGCVTKEGYPSLCTISEKMADGIRILLLSIGIPTYTSINLDRKDAFGDNPIYQIRIITNEGIRKFKDEIGFIVSEKNERLNNIEEASYEFNDIIPNQAYKLREIYDGPGRGCAKGKASRGANRELYRDIYHYLPDVSAKRNLTRMRLKYLAKNYEEVRNSSLMWFLENNQFYDEVVELKGSEALTLDLSVPENSTYIANGFVSHNTRRGANMAILRVDHPDIMEFIKCKEDTKEITNFNISVALTEKFMEAAQKGEDYDLIDPHTKKAVGKLNAREVFDLIVKMAWTNGEPGIVFIDRMNRDNPTPSLGEIESTNPCFHPDTLISTEFGLIKIKDLYEKYKDKEFYVLTDDRVLQEKHYINGVTPRKARVYKTGVKKTVKVSLNNGQTLKVTGDHKILTTKGFKEAKDLNKNDEVLIQSKEGLFSKEDKIGKDLALFLGWLTLNGWMTSDGASIGMTFDGNEEYILKRMKSIGESFKGESIVNRKENGTYQMLFNKKDFVEVIKSLGFMPQRPHEKVVVKDIFTGTKDTAAAYLNGIFSSYGTVNSDEGDIKLTSASLKLLQDVQLLLLNLGIYSNICEIVKENPLAFKYMTMDGEERVYETKDYYELIICGDNIVRFRESIGDLIQRDKNEKLKEISAGLKKDTDFMVKVKAVEEDKEVEVYDINENVTGSLIANGIVVHNCGEQPLLPYESCNLGSINLVKMLKENGGKYEIDYEELERTVKIAVHFLDNVIDVNKYPLDEIDKMTKSTRKIGLGIMGFADMLMMLNISYNSEEAVKLAENIMKFINEKSKEESRELAKVRGAFPAFENSIYKDEEPLRNATTTTIAPTGTISIIGGASSGVEPLFAVAFVRNVMDNDKLVEVHPYFEKVMKERGLYSKELMMKVAKEGTIAHIKEIPEDIKKVFVTAHDVTPVWHIRMQAAFQKYTDNAVSKTVNFRNDASEKEVRDVFTLAYKLGCKGVTIYRDGSRSGQVLNVGTDSKKIGDISGDDGSTPRERPQLTKGITEKVRVGCGNLYVTVNYDENGICEVFTNVGKAGGCPSQSEATARLISIGLRSGMDVESIIHQLKGIRCHSTLRQRANNSDIKVLSCPDAIARTIEKLMNSKEIKSCDDEAIADDMYIEDLIKEEKPKKQDVCPECGNKITHADGCVICPNCGYSKCS